MLILHQLIFESTHARVWQTRDSRSRRRQSFSEYQQVWCSNVTWCRLCWLFTRIQLIYKWWGWSISLFIGRWWSWCLHKKMMNCLKVMRVWLKSGCDVIKPTLCNANDNESVTKRCWALLSRDLDREDGRNEKRVFFSWSRVLYQSTLESWRGEWNDLMSSDEWMNCLQQSNFFLPFPTPWIRFGCFGMHCYHPREALTIVSINIYIHDFSSGSGGGGGGGCLESSLVFFNPLGAFFEFFLPSLRILFLLLSFHVSHSSYSLKLLISVLRIQTTFSW